MPDTKRKIITEEQWKQAVETFELGYQHANQIARDLGVSSATVSREFKRRGAIKARRVAETVVELVAVLDEKDRRRAAIQEAREAALAKRSAEIDALMDELMRAIVAGAKKDDLSTAASTINRIGGALGVRLER